MSDTTRYVLDTNVLLFDPEALLAFPGAEVIVPITVIEEIDQFKSEVSETGRNARLVSKTIDRYRRTGSLSDGVEQENGSRLRVYVWNQEGDGLPRELDLRRSGNRVLACGLRVPWPLLAVGALLSVGALVEAHREPSVPLDWSSGWDGGR